MGVEGLMTGVVEGEGLKAAVEGEGSREAVLEVEGSRLYTGNM